MLLIYRTICGQSGCFILVEDNTLLIIVLIGLLYKNSFLTICFDEYWQFSEARLISLSLRKVCTWFVLELHLWGTLKAWATDMVDFHSKPKQEKCFFLTVMKPKWQWFFQILFHSYKKSQIWYVCQWQHKCTLIVTKKCWLKPK